MTFAQVAVNAPVDTPEIIWWALLPLLCLGLGGVLMLTVASVRKDLPDWFWPAWTIAAAAAAIVTAVVGWHKVGDQGPTSTIAGSLGVDQFAMFVTVVISCAVILGALLSHDYLTREALPRVELYCLMLLSASGGVVMAMANDLIITFLGLEVLSIAVYVLAAYHLRRNASREAGIKYFVLGAFSSAFFLYGIALVYGATGSTNLIEIQAFLGGQSLEEDALLLIGFALLLVGFAFKIGSVPFHAWTPDVYEGSPTPVVAFMASAVKVAAFAGLMRVFVVSFAPYREDWQPVVYALAVASLVVGALLAVVQTDVKRMLAYSSINHAGFILLGVQAGTPAGVSGALFYLGAYTFMVAGAFGVVSLVSRTGDERHSLDDFRGLFRNRPVLALAFTVFLLSQAGVPFTTGFIAKVEVISAAADARSFWLAIVAMITAVVAGFMYLRIVVTMYSDVDADDDAPVDHPARVPLSPAAMAAIAIAAGVTLVFGLAPGVIDDLARDALPALVAAP